MQKSTKMANADIVQHHTKGQIQWVPMAECRFSLFDALLSQSSNVKDIRTDVMHIP